MQLHTHQNQILRIGHVYSPGEEKYRKKIPVTMQRILKGDTINLLVKGKEIRITSSATS
jgi:UDP-glucose 4-epimerase